MPFAVGDQVAVLYGLNPLPRVMAGPLTVTTVMPHRTYRLNDGQLVGEIILRPWTADTMVGAFIPGFNPQMAPAGQFAVGQQVALRFSPAVRETISGGPYLHNGVVVYETQNGEIMRREDQLIVPGAVPQPPPPPPPPPPPVGQFAVGQLVRIRWAPDRIERISHGPFWDMGRIAYRTHQGNFGPGAGHLVYPEGDLIPYVPPAAVAAAAPAGPYDAIANAAAANIPVIPAGTEDTLTYEDIVPGDEMVNLRGPQGWESAFGRYYKRSSFDAIAPHFGVPGHPGLRLKKNPAQGNFLFAANVRRYRAAGGRSKRQRKSKNRKTRRR